MKVCLKFLTIILLSIVAQATTTTPTEECGNVREENIKLGTENAELRLEIFRLKGENYKLSQQNAKLLIDKENCTAFADNVDSISTSLGNIQQEFKPLFTHFNQKFKLNKTSNVEHLQAMSDRVNSYLIDIKSYVKEQVNLITNENQQILAELRTVREGFTAANNVTAISNTCLNDSKTAVKPELIKSCADVAKYQTGIFEIEISNSKFPVYCDSDNWMVILRRVDGTVDFHRNWAEYKEGFGDLSGNFIMGLEKIHQITKAQCHELKVILQDFDNISTHALYAQFEIDNESNGYAIKTLGNYSGTAGDSFTYSAGQRFTTIDRDNDGMGFNCAVQYKAAWWYKNCAPSKLTAVYLPGGVDDCNGIQWGGPRSHCYSFKYAKMIIRPTTC